MNNEHHKTIQFRLVMFLQLCYVRPEDPYHKHNTQLWIQMIEPNLTNDFSEESAYLA